MAGESDEIFDIWSILHMTTGLIVISILISLLGCKWYVFGTGVILHQIFELWENSQHGIDFWNKPNIIKVVDKLPGLGFTEYAGDTATNSASDTLFFTFGGMIALYMRCG